MVECPECGEEIPEGANFCHKCGADASDEPDSDGPSGADEEEVAETEMLSSVEMPDTDDGDDDHSGPRQSAGGTERGASARAAGGDDVVHTERLAATIGPTHEGEKGESRPSSEVRRADDDVSERDKLQIGTGEPAVERAETENLVQTESLKAVVGPSSSPDQSGGQSGGGGAAGTDAKQSTNAQSTASQSKSSATSTSSKSGSGGSQLAQADNDVTGGWSEGFVDEDDTGAADKPAQETDKSLFAYLADSLPEDWDLRDGLMVIFPAMFLFSTFVVGPEAFPVSVRTVQAVSVLLIILGLVYR